MYQVKLQKFAGPLGKLLELIEAKQLEITTINLAEVTADFIKYVQSLEKESDPRTLADFLAVAAQLVLIKSKVLLPSLELTEEEESNIHDLEARLKLYREFKLASQHIQQLWGHQHIALARPLLMAFTRMPQTGGSEARVFYPPPKLKLTDLVDRISRLVNELKDFLPEATSKIKQTVVTLENKMKELVARLQTAIEHSFKEITKAKSKVEVVVLFLALLHLIKDHFVKVEQNGQFDDIIIAKNSEQQVTGN